MRKLDTYWHANLGIAMVGVLLLVMGLRSPDQDMLGWDNQSVLALFYFLQITPIFFAEYSGYIYFKRMREADTRTRRSATLRPRRIVDFAHPFLIAAALLAYVAFVALVLAIRQSPFPGFAGLWNIFWVTAMNLLYFGAILWMLRGKKHNPHQRAEDRYRQIRFTVGLLLVLSLVGTLFLAAVLILGALDKRFLIDIVSMVFFQSGGMAWLLTTRIDTTHFDVYRDRPAENREGEQPAMS